MTDRMMADDATLDDAMVSLDFSDPRLNNGAISIDLVLTTAGHDLSIVAAEIAYDPAAFAGDPVLVAGPAAQAANKALKYLVVEPGRLLFDVKGINDDVILDGIVATLTLVPAIDLTRISTNLTQIPSAASPEATAVPIQGDELLLGAITPSVALTVTRTGTGAGTVTGSGIDCGGDCTENLASGTPVTLTATPASGSTFGGWSGACAGTGGCRVTLTQSSTVNATFSLISTSVGSDDTVTLLSTSPAIVGAGAGNDTYLLDASRLTGRERITISDSQGANRLQLVAGLSISQSLVAPTALRLTLNNGAQITVLGADAFQYAVDKGKSLSFSDFAQGMLGMSVPPSGTVTGNAVVIDAF